MPFLRSLAKLRKKPPTSHPDWMVVGLGNPGAQYSRTRHNIGFMCANRLAHRSGVRFQSSGKDRSDLTMATVGNVPVLIVEPQTYMNESGNALARLSRRYDIANDRVLIIYDDVDLPFGVVRIRHGGTSGGHRGMQSMIEALKVSEIPRIRVGIGRGPAPTKD